MIATFLFAGHSDPIHFLIGFLVAVCVFAIVIVAAKWLIGLAGIPIPQPLMVILGIVLFLFLMLWLLNYSGYYTW